MITNRRLVANSVGCWLMSNGFSMGLDSRKSGDSSVTNLTLAIADNFSVKVPIGKLTDHLLGLPWGIANGPLLTDKH